MFTCLKNKKGEGTYIYLCVIVLFISMVVSVLVLYMTLSAQIASQKRDMKSKLDGYVSEYATEAYNAIKQGQYYDSHIDYSEFKNNCLPSIGFGSTGVCIYSSSCTLTNATATVLRGDGFGLTVRYNAVIPIRWNGRTFTSISIPVTISGYFKVKY